MCGIVGIASSHNVVPYLIEGLTRLEYRGYDSSGIAVVPTTSATQVKRVRQVGRVRELAAAVPKRFVGHTGIGHTRWATHGPATVENAHPHTSESGRIAVVHNGIIDNAGLLRKRLADKGIALSSGTDTEVLAHLVDIAYTDPEVTSLEEAVMHAVDHIDGTYAVAVIDAQSPGKIVTARNGSPLIVGVGENEMYVASDVAALVKHTSTVVHLDDGEFAVVTPQGFSTFTRDGGDTTRQPSSIAHAADELSLSGHDHYMYKEILEQPDAVERALRGRLDERFATARLDGLNLTPKELRRFTRVKVLGCGSAYYVGELGASLIERMARIPSDAEAASEFRYRNPVIDPQTLYVVVSQSGETADTAFAVREVQRRGGTVVGLINVVGSTIARECDGGVYLHAGPEIAVASTKALTNMSVGFVLLALSLARVRDMSVADGGRIIAGLKKLPAQIREIIAAEDDLNALAKQLAEAKSLFFIGRVLGYHVAREGAQKFKEISYRHAEAYQTSELKHGPLALIDNTMPTVAVVPYDELQERNAAALEQIQARNGEVVAVSHDGVELPHGCGRFNVPRNEPEIDPILLTIPMQLLSYKAALHLGHDIDMPRNLAKSVTVE